MTQTASELKPAYPPMTHENLLVVLGFLEDIKERPVGFHGICFNLNRKLDEFEADREGIHGLWVLMMWVADELPQTWEHYSGSYVHPVPGVRGMSPREAYSHHVQTRTLWEGEYGKLRKDLLDYQIAWVKSQISRMEV